MSDRKIHFWALLLIAIAFFAKVISLILFGELHVNLRIFEFLSIAVYFFYIGWLGFMSRQHKENNSRYMIEATLLVVLDLVTYYLFKGWN